MKLNSRVIKMTNIETGTFAEACYDMNTIEELELALTQSADKNDMKQWSITEKEWRENIELALTALKEDRDNA